jgi:hypothetical protein
MKKLPIEFKEKWCQALRSGDYIQANAVLYDGEDETHKPKMCCLGVACDLVGINKAYLMRVGTPGDLNETYRAMLPEYIANINQAQYDMQKEGGKLAMFNDGGKSFKWIASYIERYL